MPQRSPGSHEGHRRVRQLIQWLEVGPGLEPPDLEPGLCTSLAVRDLRQMGLPLQTPDFLLCKAG